MGAITEDDWSRFVDQEVNRKGEGFFVSWAGNSAVGVATSSLRARSEETVRHFRIVVEPGRRREGIGAALLAAVHGLDAGRSGVLMQALCGEGARPGIAFLECFGFTVVECELEMWSDVKSVPSVPTGSEFLIERAADPEGVAAPVAELHNEAYAGDVSFVAFTPEGMGRLLAGRAEVYVAREPSGRIVGYCHTEPGTAATWIESVVVGERWRGRGLGTRLTAAALSAIRDRGQAARLQVSDKNPAAIAVYTRLGFSEVSRSMRYRAERGDLQERLERL